MSRSYQQRPECLPKDQSVKELSIKTRAPTEGPERQEVTNNGQNAKLEQTTSDRHEGNHTRIGRSYTMAVPMNISSHREVGDLIVEINKQQSEGQTRPLIRTRKKMQEADHETTYDKTITIPNAR